MKTYTSQEILAKLYQIFKNALGEKFNKDSLIPQSNIQDDLGIDSLEIVEIVLSIENTFSIDDISEKEMSKFQTVQDMVDCIILHTSPPPKRLSISIVDILEILPHRYPFIMIDRISSCEPMFNPPQIRALKNVSINEPFFQGHFPEEPIMPGVLMLEGMAQTAGVLLYYLLENDLAENTIPGFLSGIDKAKFRKKVTPGDQIIYSIQLKQDSRGIYKFTALAEVDGHKAAEAIITLAKNPK